MENKYEVITIKVGGWTFRSNGRKRDEILNEYLSNGWELVDENKFYGYYNGLGASTTTSLTFRRKK